MPETPHSPRVQHWKLQVLRMLGAGAVTFLLSQVPLHYVESLLSDFRMRARLMPKPSGHIELIMIKSSTISKFGGFPGFEAQTQLLKKLATAEPAAVIYIRKFAALQSDPPEARSSLAGDLTSQKDFLSETKKFPVFGMQTDEMAQFGEENKLLLMPPFESIKVYSGPKSSDRNLLAKDGVSRRTLVSYQNQPLMHVELARLINKDLGPTPQDLNKVRGLFELFDSNQIYVDYSAPGAFSTTDFEQVTSGKVSPEKFRGKIVLIGEDSGDNVKDYASTPLDREPDLPVVELHANAIDTLIRNSAPLQVHKFWDWFFTFIISAITIFVVLALKPGRGMLILLGMSFSFVILCLLLFAVAGLWIPMAHSLTTVFLCYYFLIPYRLILENRMSWEYYQKNKLLQEVEQLKTNFISMMSHDLKTPIARIQGMTDLIRKDKIVLSSQQSEAVETIRSSAADLLSFINSILNYAKIESQGIELHREPKDVNQILEDVIKRHDFMAKVKGMKIEKELEPLFSISVDPDLIRQIFSNLLENALKYSPEGSRVVVTSKEVENFVQVEFQDEGPGIAQEDLEFVFMKFFRSKEAKSSPVKGSGLGLYLTKYFTELHGGRVFVTSTLGKGTCFTVQLPLKV